MSETQNEDKEFEVEVVDDTPEQDRGKYVAPEKTESDEDISVNDDEISHYKEDVQRRIKEMSFKTHAERRAKEALLSG